MRSHQAKFWLAFVISLILFFAPLPEGEGKFHLDKIAHAFIFFMLIYLGLESFRHKPYTLLLLLVLYAVAVEYMQRELFSYRTFDYMDLVWDGLGIAVGTLVVNLKKTKERINLF